MKNNVNYKSRFRILKGGKISLMVSALLVGASISTPAIAADYIILYGETNTTQQVLNATTSDTLTIYAANPGSGEPAGILELTNSDSASVFINTSGTITIQNSGTISNSHNTDDAIGIQAGIYPGSLVTIDGSITNNNLINTSASATDSTATGIIVFGFLNGTITNSVGANITAQGKNANGIFGFGYVNSSITNSGTISTISTGESVNKMSVGIGSYFLNGTIENNGTISATSTDSNGTGTRETSSAIGINNFSVVDGGEITNNAGESISVQTGDATSSDDVTRSGFATGISVGGGIQGNATITNDGDITVTSGDANSTTNAYSGDSIGIYTRNINNSTITNSGTITTTSGSADGYDSGTTGKSIGIKTGILTASSIENSNAIISNGGRADSHSGAYTDSVNGIATSNLDNSTITNRGTITVTGSDAYSHSGAYTDSVNGIATSNLDNSTITNRGTITVTGSDAYSYYGDVNERGITAGIYVDGSLSNSSTITNRNTINVTAGDVDTYDGNLDRSKASGIMVSSSIDETSSIVNSADITILSSGTDTFAIQTGLLEGTILNSGTLTSTNTKESATGIDINGNMRADSKITNSGNIIVDGDYTARGIASDLMNINATIINEGNITVTSNGNYSKGIEIREMHENSSITNSGNIVANGPAKASGLSVSSMYKYSSITNEGSITITSDADSHGIYISSMKGNSSITNTNNIMVTSNSGSASGIYVEDSIMRDSATITNTDTGIISVISNSDNARGIQVYGMDENSSIVNDGTITVSGSASEVTGIHLYYDGNSVMNGYSSITNSGDINVTASSGKAFGLQFVDGGMEDNSNITNTGDIEVIANNSEAYGMYINSMNLDSQIINDTDGVITVSGATGAVGISMDAMHDDSKIINRGTVYSYIGSELDADAYSIKVDAMNDNSIVENTSTGKLYGNINIAGTLSNAGLISLPYNATNASVGTFINASTGKLQIGLLTDGTIGNTTYSKLSTTDATFESGSTIDVNVLAASTNVGLLKGQTLNDVVSASNLLTINGTLNVTDNSALLNFEYVKDGNTIDLTTVQAQTIEQAVTPKYTPKTTTNNTQNAARVLDTINANGSYTAMIPVFEKLNSLPTNEAVAQAVESTTPQTTSATVGATTQISNGIAGIVEQRQNVNIGGGLNSGDGMFVEKNAWVKPFGSIGNQNDKDGMNGFDLKTYGIGMGVDAEYKDNQKLGLAFFYTKANVDVNNVQQEAGLDVFTTLVYGNVPIIDDKTNFLYQAGYAWQKTNTQRSVFTGDVATSDYTSKTASLDLKVMRDYQINDKLLLQPMVSTTYRHFTNPAYSEKGAGALNLDVKEFTSSELLVGIGTQVHYKLDEDSKLIGNLNVDYDLHDNSQTVSSSYQGATGVNFDTAGIDNGRWSYDVGIGYERDITKMSNFNVSYNYQGEGSDFSNNIISAKYVLKF